MNLRAELEADEAPDRDILAELADLLGQDVLDGLLALGILHERLVEQTGVTVKALEKRMPRAAKSSRIGVATSNVP